MCGIAGIWNCQGRESADVAVGTMLDAMAHRGPDGRGMMNYAGGAAGMVRLALVDLSPRGRQPLWSPCGRVAILFNGEIYNFRDERARLESAGHVFRTTTDTEVILTLYLERGLDFVDRLRGMFAIALFDWRETKPDDMPVLTLVRSPFGIKPLYLAHPNGRSDAVVFASELRGLLSSELVPREVDRHGLADFLSYGFVVQPRTIIAGVRMLEPGTMERYVPGNSVERRRYWQLPPAEPRNETFEEAAARLRHALDDSVRLHALADAPVGAFLSGGIDSTTIVALMRNHVRDLRTYTLRFPDQPGGDEAESAASTAERLGCRHTVVDVTGRDAASLFPTFAAEIDQPSTDGLNTWLISRAAARDVKGVLSGVGGDEWFAGYPVVRRMVNADQSPWKRLRRSIAWGAHYLRGLAPSGSATERLANVAARRSLLTLWLQPHRVFPPEQALRMADLTEVDAWRRETESFRGVIARPLAGESPVGLACVLDVYGYLMCQLLRDSDAASMAHSLELRVPFCDLKLADFSRSCRDEYKLSRTSQGRQNVNKRVLIHAVRDLLSPDVEKSPKRGFTMPYGEWMREALQPLVEDACEPGVVRRRGLIDPAFVEPLFAARGRLPLDVLYPRLWALMIFELWARAVLDAPTTRTPGRPATVLQ